MVTFGEIIKAKGHEDKAINKAAVKSIRDNNLLEHWIKVLELAADEITAQLKAKKEAELGFSRCVQTQTLGLAGDFRFTINNSKKKLKAAFDRKKQAQTKIAHYQG